MIKVDSNVGILYFAVKDADGHEVGTGASPGHPLTLPPGKYILEIDAEKRITTITDDQRKIDVELSASQELEIAIN
jgi:hypothetical protein